ncbi:MAG: cation-translocating P-type ATPase [Spartobacteria bacterium]|nr:cation-translocating P-type ATPase [Spartobacteria bacterium]
MQTCCLSDHSHGKKGGREASRLLLLVLTGMAFVVNSYLARFFYPANPLSADISAAAGALLLAGPVFYFALRSLFRGQVGVNELVAVAVLSSFVFGDFQTAGIISFFMLISLVIETRTAEGAHASIEELIRITPTTARRLLDGQTEEIPASALRPGDVVRALPGETIPADGTIRKGRTTLNEATITGESLPRDKGPDDEVFAGTLNLTGAVEVVVTRAGEDTTLGRVRDLIITAEQTKLPFMRFIDRYAGYYMPSILMLTAIVWFFTHDTSRVVALLVVACPCAIILATPSALIAAVSAAAKMGILIKHVADLEAAARIDALVFDKTGTLTTGELGVARLAPREGVNPSTLLAVAAGAEQFSNHPTALALMKLAGEAGLKLPEPEDFHEEPGQGVVARLEGKETCCGRASWMRQRHIDISMVDINAEGNTDGYSILYVARNGAFIGWIGLQDQLRPEAAGALERLRALHVKRLGMFTGDRASVARDVARALDPLEFKAECLPDQKVTFVNTVREAGYHVAVIGDGVNDAPALAVADIGIAMGAAGSDVAIHSATIALMNNDLNRIPYLLQLARSSRRVIHQNLGIALLFIVGGLILSGAGYLNPIVAAVLHNLGSLIVVFNSARLTRPPAGESLRTGTQ